MHSLDNLRGIPKEINSDLHLSKIRKEWNKFYKEFPNPTKEQLLQKRLDIDKKYGHLFKPPIDVEIVSNDLWKNWAKEKGSNEPWKL